MSIPILGAPAAPPPLPKGEAGSERAMRVRAMKVIQSIPLLDDAAGDAVRQWVFAPATKSGRPVATLALAPVRFQIY